MWGTISPGECSALYRLVATSPTDLVVKTDRRGRIVHATAGSSRLGMAFAGDPVGRHILELIDPSFADIVIAEHSAAMAGSMGGGWIEVLVVAQDGAERWMEMKLGALPERNGALCMMRSIEDRRSLENRLFVAAMTDPLTGLTNRAAFTRMLGHLVESGAPGHLALFDLDHFRTINLRHGHSGGDRVLIAFARLLRTLLRADDILSRIDGGTFGVLLPDADQPRAIAACQRVVEALGEMDGAGRTEHRFTASGGIAPFHICADTTLREAELALLSAKSRGRARIEQARCA
ncbi:sensor domain-containing diguanylate cyclase [Altererythrobacter sp. TH136]|uniref:GGDEF domain-containing protein n=1 Tax=Altererythrobacter sp. TH136 TaxID=2067415 RepID=UPI0011629C78|nr:sensor domain-containing diguanylate cyclase [Altererythrobacter sp. TH136]QDM41580.1 diguanylate cyclase [Altererythrobacter sp. TH136]